MSDVKMYEADVKAELEELARLGVGTAKKALAKFKSYGTGQMLQEGVQNGLSVADCADQLRLRAELR